MLVPVKLILDSSRNKNLEELRLYLSLRFAGDQNGGFYNLKQINNFTYQSKRILSKKLVVLGWRHKDVSKVISVYKVEDHPVCADCKVAVLENKAKFKGWVLAVAESYIARNNHRINKGWKKEFDYRSKKFVRKHLVTGVIRFSDGEYKTQIANSFLSNLLGISPRTVSRWRKNSINKYEITQIYSESQYRFEEGKFFFDTVRNLFSQWVLHITTKVFIYSSGIKHCQNAYIY